MRGLNRALDLTEAQESALQAIRKASRDAAAPLAKELRDARAAEHAAIFADALDVMRTLTPTHVVFNGRKGALTGDAALTAKVGEMVLFIHAQANRDSRPHLIGGHGDHVWEAGSFNDRPDTNLETWFIRGGSAGAMAYTFRQPGVYAYVNHNLIEAVMLGATAHVVVAGDWNDDLMLQVGKPAPMDV